MFKQIKNILDLNSLRMVYFALIQSHLIYGIVGWGGAYENTLKPLEITQKRIIKIMYGLNVRFSTEHLFKYSSILSVRNMYYRAALLQLIKSKSFSYPTDVTYQTRFQTNENTVLPRMQRVIGQRGYIFVGRKLYNIIPLELKNKVNTLNFKKILSRWLVENAPVIL